MKAIILKFSTKKGEEAYHKVDKEGSEQSWHDRQIAKSVATDHILSEKPLIVKIKIKIKWLAVKVGLEQNIVKALEKYGAKKNRDYTIEVKQ